MDKVKKIKEFLEKYSKLVLIAIFIIGIITYGVLVSKMTSPAYLNVDEELYVSMARTFFFEENIAKNYEILDYNCIVYSIIISVAYFFGNAGNILFIMRMIGVILIVSSVFPIYLLSKEILKSKYKALIVSAIRSFDTRICIVVLSYTRSIMLSNIFMDFLFGIFEI